MDAFTDVNALLDFCVEMKDYIKTNNVKINSRDPVYKQFIYKLSAFYEKYSLKNTKYQDLIQPYDFPNGAINGAFCYEEIEMLEKVIIKIKFDLFGEYCEKIFISHSEKDATVAKLIVNLLHTIGIPRPAPGDIEMPIFCSSFSPYSARLSEPNKLRIKQELTGSTHAFTILLYSDNYFISTACLNEMGAVWILGKTYQEILLPGFDYKKINGLLENTPTWFVLDDILRLNDLKNLIVKRFGLRGIMDSIWEDAKNDFVANLHKLMH